MDFDLLHQCFDHKSESDLDVAFEKNMMFSTFILFNFFMKLTNIQMLIKNNEARFYYIFL